jgi:hypothetical protein
MPRFLSFMHGRYAVVSVIHKFFMKSLRSTHMDIIHPVNVWYAQHEHLLHGNRQYRQAVKNLLVNFRVSTDIGSVDDIVMQLANFKRDIRHCSKPDQPLLEDAFFAMYGLPKEIKPLLPGVVVVTHLGDHTRS